MDKAIKKEKVCEVIIGLLFILPAVIGGIDYIDNPSIHTPPAYCGLMAIAGAYMLKNSLRYIFLKDKKAAEEEKDFLSDTASNS